MLETISGFFEANAMWAATCVAFCAVIMITVNIIARRSADKWREAEDAITDFEELESFSTLSRLQG